MKKFNAIKKSVAIVVAALALTLLAQVAFAIEGSFEDDGTDYEGRIVVITDSRGGTEATFCDREFLVYKAVVINPGGGPAIITTVGITASESVSAGDRFDILFTTFCDGRQHGGLVRE